MIPERAAGASTDGSVGWIVAHVITKLELGGAQRATLRELSASSFGGRPRYLLYGPGGFLDAELQALPGIVGIPIASLDRAIAPRRDLRALLELRATLRRIRASHPGRPLLVHTHSSKAGVLGRLAARAAGATLAVHSIHGFGHGHFGLSLAAVLMYGAELAASIVTDGYTADSAANLAQGRRQGIVRLHPTAVVHCPVDLTALTKPSQPRAQLRQSLGIASDAPVVLTVASLKAQKDPLTFAAVAAQVVAAAPDVIFLWAGDGELRGALEHAMVEQGIAANVRLLGWRRDVVDLLHGSDVLLLTSLWEGLPQTLGEAMATALPIVATAVDGTAEAVADGVNGYLCAPRDTGALAAATLRLIRDAPLRRRLGAAGKASAERFSESVNLATLDAFYRRLAARRARAR